MLLQSYACSLLFVGCLAFYDQNKEWSGEDKILKDATMIDEGSDRELSILQFQYAITDAKNEMLASMDKKHTELITEIENQKLSCSSLGQTTREICSNCEVGKSLLLEKLNERMTANNLCTIKLNECDKNLQSATLRADATNATRSNLKNGRFYISGVDKKVNWYMAFKECKALGMELASIKSKEEDAELMQYLTDKSSNYWISGTDLGSEGEFYWASTGQPLGDFTKFSSTYPLDNFGDGEHCLEYPSWSYATIWNDAPCTKSSRYICE